MQSTDASNITPTQTAKIPSVVHVAIQDLAEAEDLNGLIVVTAYKLAFDAAAGRRKKQFLREARRLFPVRNPRQGRGNRLRAAG